MRRGILVVIAIAIAVVGASLVYWFGFRAPPSAPQGMHGRVGAFAVPVEANKVKLDAIVETVSAVGSLRSEESVPVSSEVPGRVSEI